MDRKSIIAFAVIYVVVAIVGYFVEHRSGELPGKPATGTDERVSVIVEADSLDIAVSAVRRAGGEITHELGIIDAVAADVTRE